MVIDASQSTRQNGEHLPLVFLRDSLTAQRRITVLLYPDAPQLPLTGEGDLVDPELSVFPFCVQIPLKADEVLSSWCGAGQPPDEQVAKLLFDRARTLLDIAHPAGSVLERRWQTELAQVSDTAHGAMEFARTLLLETADGPVAAVRRGLEQSRARGLSEVEQFQAVAQLWGTEQRPIIIVAFRQADQLTQTVRWAVGIAEVVVEMRLILVVDPHAWARLQESLDSHALAILRDGLRVFDKKAQERKPHAALPPVAVERAAESDAQKVTADPGSQSKGSVEALRTRARSALAAALTVGSAPLASEDHTPSEHAEARSLAEALLHAALQADAATTGLFCLNADGGFMFGSRAAEIDLFCSSLLIAIEVDGYFHFQDKDAYRRDRAKDWLMQRQGMAVLRFLAEDVTERLELIMERVIEVVRLRRAPRAGSSATYGKQEVGG